MKEEYEIISHNNVNFHLFIVNLLYRTPHIHRDYEICLILDGSLTLYTPSDAFRLNKHDIFVTNPFFRHEIKAEQPALVLSLQVSPSLFSVYYPQIENTYLDITALYDIKQPEKCKKIRGFMLDIAFSYFQNESLFEFKCAALLNQLFYYLLCKLPNHQVSESEKKATKTKGIRMQNITRYIDEHYSEKLLLSDIAEQMDLNLYYLSHFFKECFGVSFQNYLVKIRCEHARQLLLSSDYSLLDISISCGFSDPKYFNKSFKQQYGYTPKEYRRKFKNDKKESQQKFVLSMQEFLSSDMSSDILRHYLSPT